MQLEGKALAIAKETERISKDYPNKSFQECLDIALAQGQIKKTCSSD